MLTFAYSGILSGLAVDIIRIRLTQGNTPAVHRRGSH